MYINVVTFAGHDLSVFVFGRHAVTARKRRWPMHEIEVEVVCIEIFQRRVTGLLNVVWVVRVVP
jgi:hypothetical protein